MTHLVDISKRNLDGQETWRYTGELIQFSNNLAIVRAEFDNVDMDVHGLQLNTGDLFIEYYYFDRWFNIFQVFSPGGEHFKGWYCNIASPAQMDGDVIYYTDLALDLIVFPENGYLVLDIDEFERLSPTPSQKQQALIALNDLILGLNQKGRYTDLPFRIDN